MDSHHEISVEVAVHEDPIDFRVKQIPPPWLRMAQAAIRIGSVLLVLAVILFTAVIAERFDLMQEHEVHPVIHADKAGK